MSIEPNTTVPKLGVEVGATRKKDILSIYIYNYIYYVFV